jgi:RNA polymerase sporulation-specific sigma factor
MRPVDQQAMIARTRLGDEAAFERLLDQYEGLLVSRIGTWGTRSLDFDDLMQVARLAFHKAVCTWDASRSNFRNFAVLAIDRAIYTAIKTALRGKHRALNEAASLDEPLPEAPEMTLADALPGSCEMEPCAVHSSRERVRTVLSAVDRLSPLERAALIGVANGFSYAELADREQRPVKSIDNAIQRAHARLRAAA